MSLLTQKKQTFWTPFAFDIPLAAVYVLKMATLFLDSRSSETKMYVIYSLLKRWRHVCHVFDFSSTYISLLAQTSYWFHHVFCVRLSKSRKEIILSPFFHQKTSNLMFFCQRSYLYTKNSNKEAPCCLLLPALKPTPPPPMFLYSGNGSYRFSVRQNSCAT